MTTTAKETKAQRVERLKRSKNPWEGLEEIRRFAREGFESIPPEWLGTYFRWWGVYTQGDGAGVTGGQNGEGRSLQCFMVRIRIPNGLLHSDQLRTIANLTTVSSFVTSTLASPTKKSGEPSVTGREVVAGEVAVTRFGNLFTQQ